MRSTYVVHYSEVALKGKNRPEFLRALRRNLVRSLWGREPEVTLKDGRFVVSCEGDEGEATARIAQQFGVAWVARVDVVEGGYEEILPQVVSLARAAGRGSFKVDARRSDKTFPITSQELASKLGAAVVSELGLRVDLTAPDSTLHVDVTREGTMVYSQRVSGPGGLPVGTAGRVIHLFSGGIDSPVAAWLLMKRGCVPVYLHFYLAPTPGAAIDSKVTRLVKLLAAYSGKATLVLAPFAEYQLVTAGAPGDLEPSLFRRFMRMTAEAVASKFGASAVSTGDSLSQAASQTVWNMASNDYGSTLPVLRPLLTYDKEEIVKLARRIGTYDISLGEYKDCCAIVTKHPRTRVKAEFVSEYVQRFALGNLVPRTIEASTLVSYNSAGGSTKITPLSEAGVAARGAEAQLGPGESDL